MDTHSSGPLGRRFIVRGKVQGVFFRAYAQQKATHLQLTGWVRNNADGCVECEAFGEKERLEKFKQWLQIGSPLAAVVNVNVLTIPFYHHPHFVII